VKTTTASRRLPPPAPPACSADMNALPASDRETNPRRISAAAQTERKIYLGSSRSARKVPKRADAPSRAPTALEPTLIHHAELRKRLRRPFPPTHFDLSTINPVHPVGNLPGP
jgi:hypothetical protein